MSYFSPPRGLHLLVGSPSLLRSLESLHAALFFAAHSLQLSLLTLSRLVNILSGYVPLQVVQSLNPFFSNSSFFVGGAGICPASIPIATAAAFLAFSSAPFQHALQVLQTSDRVWYPSTDLKNRSMAFVLPHLTQRCWPGVLGRKYSLAPRLWCSRKFSSVISLLIIQHGLQTF